MFFGVAATCLAGMMRRESKTHMKKTFFLFLSTLVLSLIAAGPGGETDPAKAGPEYQVQGEYAGKGIGVQVIALGDGNYRAVIHKGGLPGDGWDKSAKVEINGKASAAGAAFAEAKGWKGAIAGKIFELSSPDGANRLEKVMRKSSSLGMKPPKGAVVLFDGSSAKNFKPGKMTEDGLLMQGANSIQRFGDHRLHIEFRLPFKPKARGQGRGNSGCYLQARYEVQMLDSFGLTGHHNECGGIYSIKPPDLNMCYPPLSWQTYDVEFTAAKFKDGKKVEDARITVFHNGVKIHNNVKLPKRTTASPLPEGPGPGFLHLQNHGNPVRYRNIWVVEKK
tara:strand:+ start:3644 stop:4648 length:1005 start_codon:yes stop_codon:yes gene_type:complete